MDDGIIMAQRLQAENQPVTLTVMEALPHGFLSLAGVDEVHTAQAKCMTMIKNSLKY